MEYSAYILGSLGYSLTGYVVYKILLKICGNIWLGILGLLVVLSNKHYIWAALSGMEISWTSSFCLFGVLSYIDDCKNDRFSAKTAILWGIASQFRPEIHALFMLSILNYIVRYSHNKLSRETTLDIKLNRSLLLPILCYVLLNLPYMIFCLYCSGHFLPNTFYAKTFYNTDRFYLPYFGNIFAWSLRSLAIIFIFSIVGCIKLAKDFFETPLKRGSGFITIWIVIFPILQSAINSRMFNNGRYEMPFLPFLIIAGIIGFFNIIQYLQEYKHKFIICNKEILIISNLHIYFIILSIILMAIFMVYSINNSINKLLVECNEYDDFLEGVLRINDKVPTYEKIAMPDIGLIGWKIPHYIFDIRGLATTEQISALKYPISTINLLKQKNVNYLYIEFHSLIPYIDYLELESLSSPTEFGYALYKVKNFKI